MSTSKSTPAVSVKARRATRTEIDNKKLKVTKGGVEVIIVNKLKLAKDEIAYVTYKNGASINLGNFNNQKIEIGMTLPCKPEDIKQVLTELIAQIDAEVNSRASSIKNATSQDIIL